MDSLPLMLTIGDRKLVVDNWIEMATAIAAGVALWYSHRSLRRAEQASYADMLLRLEPEMRVHQQVHTRLRSGGDWSQEQGPGDDKNLTPQAEAAEWAAVEAYMGLFERINFLVSEKLIDITYVSEFYGYRYANIYRNPVIHIEKLVKRKKYWRNFIALGDKMGVPGKFSGVVEKRLERRHEWERRNLTGVTLADRDVGT